jgi:hypothetical protein
MSYIGNEPIVSATRTITEVTATAGQTVFTANGGYTVGYIDVFLNGAQLQTVDFTATNGTTITLTEAAQVGDVIRLVAWGTFSTATHVPLTGNSNITGNINVSGNVGVGTTSPTGKLTVSAGANEVATFISTVDTNADLFIKATGTTLGNVRLRANGNDMVMIAGLAERMRIDSAGRVTMPSQPAFSALRTTSASLGGSFTTIGGWSTYVNNGSNFNASTGVFTAPVSGNYLFAFVTRGNDGSADAEGVSARLIRNGTMYLYDIWGSPGRTQDGTFRNFVSGSVVMNMAAGDTAAFQANGYFLQGNFSGCLLN